MGCLFWRWYIQNTNLKSSELVWGKILIYIFWKIKNKKQNILIIIRNNTSVESQAVALNGAISNIHHNKFTSIFWHLHTEDNTHRMYLNSTQSFYTKDNSCYISTYCYLSIDEQQWDLVNFVIFMNCDRNIQWPCVNDFPKIRWKLYDNLMHFQKYKNSVNKAHESVEHVSKANKKNPFANIS